jgi:RNase P subunit RPR2
LRAPFIQKANNEYQLTDAEQKQVRENEFESARKYDEDFNSLSEKEQIEILENMNETIQNACRRFGQPQTKMMFLKERSKPAAKEK